MMQEMLYRMRRNCILFISVFFLILSMVSCASRPAKEVSPAAAKPLPRMGYAIQAGAFAQVANAFRLTEKLKDQGLNATYFKAPDGLFKVRFGNFRSRDSARARALELQRRGVIDVFYIVAPEDYASARIRQYGEAYVREQIVSTARQFIGVPYLWGGASAETGFDCSGLTMTVYQLNGLDLPRHSAAQYDAGHTIERQALQKGDLVFFATRGRARVSHVGIYIGGDRFIHAPSKGKTIRIESLREKFYADRYVGAKKYF